MDGGLAAGPAKIGEEFMIFIQALGIDEQPKVLKLARLLRSFNDVAMQLDSHLAPVGASLHAAVSRMCESANPTAPPQYGWIRVVNRLGFFPDSDGHASRVINIGLSYAYRHMELNNLTTENALRLKDLHLTAGRDAKFDSAAGPLVDRPPTGAPPATPGPEGQLPLGDIVVTTRLGDADSRAAPAAAAGRTAGAAASPAASMPLWAGSPAAAEQDSSVVPPGCLVVRSERDAQEANHDDELVRQGGPTAIEIVVTALSADDLASAVAVRDVGSAVTVRTALDVTRYVASPSPLLQRGSLATFKDAGSLVVGSGTRTTTTVCTSRPTVMPSSAAIDCAKSLLLHLRNRLDVRDVVERLVVDSLLCFARLQSGAAVNFSTNELPPHADLTWKAVRKIVHRWWSLWESSAERKAELPPPGTVSFLSHPGRSAKQSRWAIDVCMVGINVAIKQLQIGSMRYFDKEQLPTTVPVRGVSPKHANQHATLGASVANLLLVATKEDLFPPVLSQMAALGQEPTPKSVACDSCSLS